MIALKHVIKQKNGSRMITIILPKGAPGGLLQSKNGKVKVGWSVCRATELPL